MQRKRQRKARSAHQFGEDRRCLLWRVRTFAKVAERFAVSDTAVRKWAKAGGWEERVAKLDAETRQQVDAIVVRNRSTSVADTLELIDRVRAELLSQLKENRGEVKLSDFPQLAKLELLLVGEPTERIHVSEAKAMFLEWLQIAGRYIPVERRREFLAEIEGVTETIEGRARALPETSS